MTKKRQRSVLREKQYRQEVFSVEILLRELKNNRNRDVKNFFNKNFKPLSEKIRRKQEAENFSRKKYYRPLKSLNAEKIACIVFQGICNTLTKFQDDKIESKGILGVKVISAAREIGERCKVEMLLDNSPIKLEMIIKQIKKDNKGIRDIKTQIQDLNKTKDEYQKLLKDVEEELKKVKHIQFEKILNGLKEKNNEFINNIRTILKKLEKKGIINEDLKKLKEIRCEKNRIIQWVYKTLSKNRGHQQIKSLVKRHILGEWEEEDILHLGIFLIKLIDKIGFGEYRKLSIKKGRIKILHLKKNRIEILKDIFDYINYPMIVPPVNWEDILGGGYLTNKYTKAIYLVKFKEWNKETIINALKKSCLNQVLEAVNALQMTPWQINLDIYETLRKMIKMIKKKIPLPEEREENKIESKNLNEEQLKIKIQIDKIKRRNKIIFKKITLPRRLKACEYLKKYQKFYFPYHLDYRGRIYSIPQVFNPQSDDLGRALIRFAEGKALNKKSEDWFKINLANLFGKVKKEPFAKRKKWVDENEENIINAAKDPIKNSWWQKADKPWCFLAACKEWQRNRKKGNNFNSHLPIYMDGTCNGFQHLCGLIRDKCIGKFVNLLSNSKPADFYQEIANRLQKLVESEFKSKKKELISLIFQIGEKINKKEIDDDSFLGIFNLLQKSKEVIDWRENGKNLLGDRKTVKQAVMATPYGITINSIAKNLLKEYQILNLKHPKTSAKWIAKKIKQVVKETAEKPIKVMGWLQNVVMLLANKKEPCSWKTPTGFRVVMDARINQKQIRYDNEKFKIYYYNPGKPILKILKKEHKNGIVPNFIHSMDAAHMMLTINELKKNRVNSFAMIHDNYGVHAYHIELLNKILREKFVEIYKKDILKSFIKGFRTVSKIKFPEFPQKGELKIEGIKKSEYFFC